MTCPKISVLPGLLSLLLACAADKGDGATTSSSEPASTSGIATDDAGDTGTSTAATTTATSTTTDASTTGAVGTTGDATTDAGTTGDATTDAGTTGADTSTSTGEPVGLSWAKDVYPQVLLNTCNCHQPPGAGGLNMTNEVDSYAILVNVKSNQTNMLRVTPGDPDNSYMLHKLNDTQEKAGGQGFPMPLTGMLSQEKRDLVAQWISEGALP